MVRRPIAKIVCSQLVGDRGVSLSDGKYDLTPYIHAILTNYLTKKTNTSQLICLGVIANT